MKKSTILLATIATTFGASASASVCKVDAEFIEKSFAEETFQTNCEFKYKIFMDSSKRRYGARDARVIALTNSPNLVSVDLSGINSPNFSYRLDLKKNENLASVNLGEVTYFNEVNLDKAQMTDFTFMNDVRNAYIYFNKDITFSALPDEDTAFCEAVLDHKIKGSPDVLFDQVKENCGYVEEDDEEDEQI